MGIAPRGQTAGRIALSFALAGACAGLGQLWRARQVRPHGRSAIRRRIEPPRGQPWRSGAEGRRHLPYRQALSGGRPDVRAGGRPELRRAKGWHPGTAAISTAGALPTARPTTWKACQRPIRRCRCRPISASPILRNQRSIILRVNDRGPYHGNRVVDVSKRAAHLLDFHGHGVARVRVEYVGRASLDGSDDHLLAATLREGEPAPAPSMVRLASARPFLPQGETRSPVLRGEVPMPSERPYTLGTGWRRAGLYRDVAGQPTPVANRRSLGSPRTLNEQAQALRATGASMLRPSISTVRTDSTVATHNLY